MSKRAGAPAVAAGQPSSRRIDQESRRAIREDLLTNILVEAGAGSGKTQMLAERMAAGVASGAYRVEHIAAVTFTRKAASELRGRFHLALERRLASGELQTDDAARVRAALSSLERFFAGTIHSFCARLLRERPVEAGVSPGFTELDEVQDLELRRRAWRDFITTARAAGDPDMLALFDTGVRPGDLDSAFAIVCSHEDVTFPPGVAKCPDAKPAWDALEAFWEVLEKELPDISDETRCPIQKAARTFSGQLRVSRTRIDRPAIMAELLDTWDVESCITQKWWTDDAAGKKRLKALINPLHEGFKASVVEPWLAQWRQYRYRLSVTVLCRARHGAAAERRRLNVLNYGDLLNLTAHVLRTNPLVRRALQRKYRHLFVDEFQDTDPVQAEIVFLLAADEGDWREAGSLQRDSVIQREAGSRKLEAGVQREAGVVREAGSGQREADWRQLPLRPGALFVVGDPKQSIYRFRRADIEIYNIVRDRFSEPATGRVLPLTMNFRSVPALCEWANGVFAEEFPAEPTQHSPRFAALDPKEDAVPTAAGGVFTLTHTCDAKEVVGGRCRADCGVYPDRGRFGTAQLQRFPDPDAQEEGNRVGLRAGARAVEHPGRGQRCRSVRGVRGGQGADRPPARAGRSQDALSLVAVLRGPFFGISDRELFAFRQAGGWFGIL